MIGSKAPCGFARATFSIVARRRSAARLRPGAASDGAASSRRLLGNCKYFCAVAGRLAAGAPGPQKTPHLVGGRPCGGCGKLEEAECGNFGNANIFYCSSCWEAWARAHWEREATLSSQGSPVLLPLVTPTFEQVEELMHKGDVSKLCTCLKVRPELCVQRGITGQTLLHVAARLGATGLVRILLENFGATFGEYVEVGQCVEMYQDNFGITAGEYAFAAGHQETFDVLVESVCRRARPSNFCTDHNKAYVRQTLKYDGDVLLDASGRGVMMGWERPLMAKHAHVLARTEGMRVLNVGFGLGLIDGFLQEKQPANHTIVEAHPDVYDEMRRRGWLDAQNVQVIFGRWQDVLAYVVAHGPYDGVFFDTYAEMYGDLQQFFTLLPRLLRTGGRFSFFNGLSDSNIFAQAISCRVAQIDLSKLGLACVYEPVVLGEVSSDEWRKVLHRYWSLETYYLPIAVLLPSEEAIQRGERIEIPRGSVRSSAVQCGDRVGSILEDKLHRARADGHLPSASIARMPSRM